jgi:hypothetical protein
MELLNIFDKYDQRARVLPSVIIALPALCTALFCFPHIDHSPIFLVGSGIVLLAIVYLIAHVVRFLGVSAEPELWDFWGGPPSTRLLRWRDRSLSEATKAQLRLAVQTRFRMSLPSVDREASDPAGADLLIMDAFRRVREFLRSHGEDGLWQKHNTEYGFARNLFGGRWLFLVLAVSGAVVSGFAPVGDGTWRLTSGVVINLCLLSMWLPFAWFVLPSMVKHAADRYAERAWLAFGELTLETHSSFGAQR